MARKRRDSERTSRERKANEERTPSEHIANPEAEADTDSKPKALEKGPTMEVVENEPEWAAEDEERPQDFQIPENLLKEMA
jgi:hypothetical protein